jgi:hypothetical protein
MTDPDAPVPVSRWRLGLRQALLGAVVMAVALCIGLAIPLAPLWIDDWKLDGVVRAVALDVRDFGEEKGWDRLRFELAAQGLEARLPEEQCSVGVADGAVTVACAWEVVIDVPVVQRRIPLRFRSVGFVDAGGDLH